MPVERVAIFDCALSTERQAERGRQKLRIYAFRKSLRKWESVAYFQIGKLHFTLNQYTLNLLYREDQIPCASPFSFAIWDRLHYINFFV